MEFHRSFYCDLVVIEWFFGEEGIPHGKLIFSTHSIYCVDKKVGIFFGFKLVPPKCCKLVYKHHEY